MPRKLNYDNLQAIVAERGGRCRGLITNATTKILWECSEGHTWKAAPSEIISGRWCPVCGKKNAAQKRRLTLEEMQWIAGERNGLCLSKSYKSAQSKLLWQCSGGHQWEANPNSIKRGSWCPTCWKEKAAALQRLFRLSIQEMQKIAEGRGGFCLSNEYEHSHSKLLWECSKGHQWLATPTHIKSGEWCRICAVEESAQRQKLDFKEMHEIAEKRGGRCLSTSYENARSKLLWECAEGHQWKAVPYSIKNGTWCPECKLGFWERVCRAFFEKLFNDSFPNAYPKWLVNDNGNQLELDGYCKHLKLAFEHHGQQHYGLSTPFIKSAFQLEQIQKNDKLKKMLCKEKGITLIEIPEIGTLLKLDDLKEFIRKKCTEEGYPIPKDFYHKEILFDHAYFTSFLADLNSIAAKKGGKCLSKVYKGSDESLEWKCSEGHTWRATPHNVKKGTWCPVCAGTQKLNIEDMHRLAEERGGRCLSRNYVEALSKLIWECDKGHRWQSTPANIKSGRWCPICSKKRAADKQRLSIEDMKKLAKEKDGRCLSTNYVSSNTKLNWECKEGHRWKTTPNSVRSGKWCPVCGREKSSDKKRLSIHEMHGLAEFKGGKCLSEKYRNTQTKLLWECADGHRWQALPLNVKRGSWCPICGKKKAADKQRLTLKDMHMLAGERGGRCLSTKYVNALAKLNWECDKGHRWAAAPACIKSGTWCPKCSKKRSAEKQRHTIEDMQKVAEERSGHCLSSIYTNSENRLLWECSKGHRWEATPKKIAQGNWCPVCAGNIKKTINDMQLLAKERGGQCLSTNYKNQSSKLLWRCSKGHQWEAIPSNIMRGSWCPICAKHPLRVAQQGVAI